MNQNNNEIDEKILLENGSEKEQPLYPGISHGKEQLAYPLAQEQSN